MHFITLEVLTSFYDNVLGIPIWDIRYIIYQRSVDTDTRVRGQPCPPLSADTDADTDMKVFETADTDADTDMNFSKNRGHACPPISGIYNTI